MAARALSSATISFGLVAIPVKLYSTSENAATIHFNTLHKKCGGRLKQQYICPADDNQVVEREDMVKGYEFAKGQYVTFTPEEMATLEETSSKSIEIAEFVPADQVDAVYFDKSYYLGPDKGGERPYKLLAQAMRASGQSALARYAARGKQYLVLVVPYRDGLLMQQLHYADEIRSFEDIDLGDAEIKDAELKLALQIVEQITSDSFRPDKYEDAVKARTEELIQKKIEGQEISAAPDEAPKAKVIDLMEALKQSLLARAGDAPAAEPGRPHKAPRRAAASESVAKASAKRKTKA